MSTVFVTGSGTGVGKTLVTQLLVAELRRDGRTVRAIKPIITGFDPRAPEASDSAVLLGALGMKLDTASLDRVSPWRYQAPLSPDMAAAREGRTIPFTDVVRFCVEDTHTDSTVIEGVGGVMVPIDDRHTVIDWIAAVACPAVLVTGSYLGAISHTLTALGTLLDRGINIRGIVVSESTEQPVPLAETAKVIERHAHGTRVIELPRLTQHSAAPELAKALEP